MPSPTANPTGGINGTAISSPLEETITLRQAKTLITCMAHEQSFLLLSPPGVGKSETFASLARPQEAYRVDRV